MATVPAGMESETDSDDCIQHFMPEKKDSSTADAPIAGQSSDQANTPDVTSLPSRNGNTKYGSTANPNNAHWNTKVSAQQTRRINTPRRNHKPCLDLKSTQLYDDFRFSVMQGNLDLVSSFIEKGIFVDSVLNAGWTGLMYASSRGHHEIVKYFLEKKADPNFHKDSFTPLMAACASSQDDKDLAECVQQLLQHGANINIQERHLTTALMFAAREGHIEVIKELLKHDVDLDIHDNKGHTALHWAAAKGFGQIVRLLLCKGADPHKVTLGGQTAADLAYDEGHKEVASLLNKPPDELANMADVDASQRDEKCQVDKNIQPSQEQRNSYMPAKEYNVLQKSFKPFEKTKCYVKQSELDLFLSGLGLNDLISVLNDQQVVFSDLLIMTEEDLEKVGVQQFGARKKILEATKAVHKKEWETSSLPNLKEYKYISCPDAVVMVANVAAHLKYISRSITYVRQQIQVQPRILELAQDSSNVHDLIDETQESLKNVQLLNEELRFLKLYLDKVQDNVKYIPADLIVETVPHNKSRWKGTKIVLFLVAVTVAGVLWKKPNFISINASHWMEKIKFF